MEQCRSNKNYDACFTLNEEPVLPSDLPSFIKGYAEKNVLPEVEKNKQKIFDAMKKGTSCENAATIAECKAMMNK